jgi:hypothetical protein
MKITRKRVVQIFNTLSDFKGIYNKIFSMYLVLNTKKFNSIIEEIQEIQKSSVPSEEYTELQKKELEIVNKYVEKDENNKPVMVNDRGFKIKSDCVEIYSQEKKELIDNNKNILDEYKKVIDNIEVLMDEEVDVDVMPIPFDSVPEDIEVDKLEILSDIIKDFGKLED